MVSEGFNFKGATFSETAREDCSGGEAWAQDWGGEKEDTEVMRNMSTIQFVLLWSSQNTI